MSSTWVAIGAVCIAFVVGIASSLSLSAWVCDRLRLAPEMLFEDEDGGFGFFGFMFSPFTIISSGIGLLAMSFAAQSLARPSMGWGLFFTMSLGVVALVTILTGVYMPTAYAKYNGFNRYLRGEVGDQGLHGSIMRRVVFGREFFYHVFLPLGLSFLGAILIAWHGPEFRAWVTALSLPGILGSFVVAAVLFVVGEGMFLLLLSSSDSAPGEEW